MSERGSFVTEYIYCDRCFNACKEVLCKNEKYLKGIVIPSWKNENENLPIIAGKIGGMYANEECNEMEFNLIPEIQEKMCAEHKIRIAVLAEQGQRIFEFNKSDVWIIDKEK